MVPGEDELHLAICHIEVGLWRLPNAAFPTVTADVGVEKIVARIERQALFYQRTHRSFWFGIHDVACVRVVNDHIHQHTVLSHLHLALPGAECKLERHILDFVAIGIFHLADKLNDAVFLQDNIIKRNGKLLVLRNIFHHLSDGWKGCAHLVLNTDFLFQDIPENRREAQRIVHHFR